MDTQSRFNGNTFLNTKTNQSELNKSFLKVKTDQKELNQSAFRVMTNQAEVNRSSIKNKTNQDELRRSTVQDKSNIYAKVLPDDIDEIKSRKSHMSHRTQKTGHQINILAPIEVKNPEESFISRKSGIKNHTQLDKSFASSRPRSEKKSDLDFFSSKEASVKGNKLSESRH